MDADIVIWYPEGEIDEHITNSKLHHDIDYTPFEGVRYTNWPRCVHLLTTLMPGTRFYGEKSSGTGMRQDSSVNQEEDSISSGSKGLWVTSDVPRLIWNVSRPWSSSRCIMYPVENSAS